MVHRKRDADEIRLFMEDLAQQDWLARSERRWWPQFVCHYTDILNAVSILQDGHLRSRNSLIDSDSLVVNGASQQVLDRTEEWVKDYVRLYFRPRTPAQYQTEGIRTPQTISYLGAHCPTPVFFMFDSVDVLTRANCRFSDGNLAARGEVQLFSSARELSALSWRMIYHNSSFESHTPEAANIIFHRCAEVIIPNSLDLSGLRFIYCRSEAEKDTLLHLLPTTVRSEFENRIVATTRSLVFFRRHTFLDRVVLSRNSMRFVFSPDTESAGPFHVQLTLEAQQGSPETVVDRQIRRLDSSIDVRLIQEYDWYIASLTLDGNLAYSNEYSDLVIPF